MSQPSRYLIRHPLSADLLTPLAAYLALRPAGASLLLESCDQGERVGRHSFVLIEGTTECRLDAPARGWVEAVRDLAGVERDADGRARILSIASAGQALANRFRRRPGFSTSVSKA